MPKTETIVAKTAPPTAQSSSDRTVLKGGTLDEEVKKLKDLMALIILVLFVGFAGVFVAVALFGIEAARERSATYDQLLQKVNTLQIQHDMSTTKD